MFDEKTNDGFIKLDSAIAALSDQIDAIVTAHADSEKAHAEKLEAQAALVDKMLEFVRPVVRALGTRPMIWESIAQTGARANQLATWRGLKLTPGSAPVQLTSAADIATLDGQAAFVSGTFTGSDVFLRQDGTLTELAYEGNWKKCPQIEGGWRAKESEISVEQFCRNCFLVAEPKRLSVQLVGFIDRAGDRTKPMAKAKDLATKFRAIATLL